MSEDSPMRNIRIVLVRTRFPENIGMAARAAANMGITDLILVNPENWNREKAAPLATGKGLEILDALRVVPVFADALEGCVRVFGTTARTGGWRQHVTTPEHAAGEIVRTVRENPGIPAGEDDAHRVAIVFGPEDRGLENAEIELCTDLVTIPTAPGASSLNLAQSVLVLAYACFTRSLEHAYHPDQQPRGRQRSRAATVQEREMLFAALQRLLETVDYLPKTNPGWFMRPLRHFFHRAGLKRHEFDIVMGICRNLFRRLDKTDKP